MSKVLLMCVAYQSHEFCLPVPCLSRELATCRRPWKRPVEKRGEACITLSLIFPWNHHPTWVKATDAVLHDKQGTIAIGLSQKLDEIDAIYKEHSVLLILLIYSVTWPPIDIPVMPSGPYPCSRHQLKRAAVSNARPSPITKRSLTYWRAERLREKNWLFLLEYSPMWRTSALMVSYSHLGR